MKTRLVLLFPALLLSCSLATKASAGAILVDTELGVATAARDTLTNLDWLNLSLTTGRSWESVRADAALSSWRPATVAEVKDFLLRFQISVAGIGLSVRDTSPDFAAAKGAFFDVAAAVGFSFSGDVSTTAPQYRRLIFGQTADLIGVGAQAAFGLQYDQVGMSYTQGFPGYETIDIGGGVGYAWSNPHRGTAHWLVREGVRTVPEAPSMLLVMLGAAVIILRRSSL